MNFKQFILVITPPVLILTTAVCFSFTTSVLGQRLGYFVGFLFYWLFWCFTIPLFTIGWGNIKSSFAKRPACIGQTSLTDKIMLASPLLLGYGYAFPKAVGSTNLLIIVSSFIIALVNATLEETLWRASYIKSFPNNKLMSWIYPSLSFGVWHYAPQTVFPNRAPGAMVSFIVVAMLVGFFYGFVARKYSSIFWVTISHILFDFSGLGGQLYFGK